MTQRISLVDLVSICGGAADAYVVAALDSAGFDGLRARHGYVFQRLLVEPQSITHLADALSVTQQAMSKTIAELVGLGYVEASVDLADARRRVLSLTDRGRAAVAEARSARAALERRVRETVGVERLRAAQRALEALVDELGLSERIAARTVPIPGE